MHKIRGMVLFLKKIYRNNLAHALASPGELEIIKMYFKIRIRSESDLNPMTDPIQLTSLQSRSDSIHPVRNDQCGQLLTWIDINT